MRRSGVLLIVGLLAACGSDPASSRDTLPEPAVSIGGDWVATDLTVGDVAVTVNPPLVSMSISGSQVTGVAACNSYGATLQLDGGSFALTGLAATEMACEPPAIMETEHAVLDALASISTFVLTDELVLASADGSTSMTLIRIEIPATTLREPAVSLDGSWSAIGATVDGGDVTDLGSVEVTLEVGGGRMAGSSGCNRYEVAIEVTGDTITFGARSATEAFCSGPPGEVEGLVGALTSGTATWVIEGDVLTLTNGDATWRFERTGDEALAPVPTTVPSPAPGPAPPEVFGGLDGPVMFTGPDASVVADDTAVGTLFLGDDCLVLMRDDQTTMVLVIWPYGTTWHPDGIGVVLPSGDVLGLGPVVQVDGTVIDGDALASYADNPAVRDEINRCTRTEPTLLFVAA